MSLTPSVTRLAADIERFLLHAHPSLSRIGVLSRPAKLAALGKGGIWSTVPFIGEEQFELTGTRMTPAGRSVVTLFALHQDKSHDMLTRVEIPESKLCELFPDLLTRIEAFSAEQDEKTIKEVRESLTTPCAAETDSRFGSW